VHHGHATHRRAIVSNVVEPNYELLHEMQLIARYRPQERREIQPRVFSETMHQLIGI
jgi:hypothetical protein